MGHLPKVDKRKEAILRESEEVDGHDEMADTLLKMKGDLQNQRALREKIERIALELLAGGCMSIDTTDPDCVFQRKESMAHTPAVTDKLS
jgi:hypothetical protein